MTNLDSILRSRNITLLTKVHVVKTVVLPVIMYGCESWNIKKAECQRTDTFKLWCWRRLLRVPWVARRANQSTLKEINLDIPWKDWCWSWSFSALASWCKELTRWKDPNAGKDWRQKEKEGTEDEMIKQHHWLNGRVFEQTLGDSEGQGIMMYYNPWGHKRSDMS